MDYDVIIIGSGFGGSVSALRLSEKGYSVAVLEQGRRFSDQDLEKSKQSMRHLFWMPSLGMTGIFYQRFFRNLTIVGGVGVGGGSLVYAAVLLEPDRSVFRDPAWMSTGEDWWDKLRPHYATAATMLGRTLCPHFHLQDEYLRKTANTLGAESSYGPVPLGIYFGDPGITQPDPYFSGKGPDRNGCKLCGACLAGCAYNAKNSLDKNYLYLAEANGAKLFSECKVTLIRPVDDGYQVEIEDPIRRNIIQPLKARKIVLAAGVLGTLELLFRCRQAGSLPNVSQQLGATVRTNSEAITGILHSKDEADLTFGPAISSHFYPDSTTHVTQNRLPESYDFMRLYSGPLVDGSNPLRRMFAVLNEYLRHPLASSASLRTGSGWTKRASLISTMQSLDNQISFKYKRTLLNLFQTGLVSGPGTKKAAPTYISQANKAARAYAQAAQGIPHNSLLESMLNMSVTAHILGGCVIGSSPQDGVIDVHHQMFGYPGLYVVDASAIPANLGVNPSLTITAMAERAMVLMSVNGAVPEPGY